MLLRAMQKANDLHKNQFYKVDKNLPRFDHLSAVMLILSNHTSNEIILVASLLHEAINDEQGYRYKDLWEDFGIDIAQIVREITEFRDLQADQSSTWLDRRKKYLSKFKDASYEALMIIAADKIHNLQIMIRYYEKYGQEIFENFDVIIDKKIWFYEACLNQLREQNLDNPIIEELAILCRKARETFASALAR